MSLDQHDDVGFRVALLTTSLLILKVCGQRVKLWIEKPMDYSYLWSTNMLKYNDVYSTEEGTGPLNEDLELF